MGDWEDYCESQGLDASSPDDYDRFLSSLESAVRREHDAADSELAIDGSPGDALYFETFAEASLWAKRDARHRFTRAADGIGYTPVSSMTSKPESSRGTTTVRWIEDIALTRQLSPEILLALARDEVQDELLAVMEPNDELWEFTSSADSWLHLAGRAGVAVVRGEVVVHELATAMN